MEKERAFKSVFHVLKHICDKIKKDFGSEELQARLNRINLAHDQGNLLTNGLMCNGVELKVG